MINYCFSFFGVLDSAMSHALPLIVRLIFWGAASGIIAIVLYAKISPQKKIADLKKRALILKKELKNIDLEFKDFYSISVRNLKNSLEQLFLVTGPAVASAIPVLMVAIWLQFYFGYAPPQKISKELFFTKGSPADLEIKYEIEGVNRGAGEKNETSDIFNLRKLVLTADKLVIYGGNPFSPPTDALYKRKWWNWIIESPNGYLEPNSPIDDIGINVTKYRVLKEVPDWASGWEFPYFLSAFVFAIAIKYKFNIQ
jgi:hypothetical protein